MVCAARLDVSLQTVPSYAVPTAHKTVAVAEASAVPFALKVYVLVPTEASTARLPEGAVASVAPPASTSLTAVAFEVVNVIVTEHLPEPACTVHGVGVALTEPDAVGTDVVLQTVPSDVVPTAHTPVAVVDATTVPFADNV
jgi:hypothetical protein